MDVSQRLLGAIRSGDTLARFGGDEFVIVCEAMAPPEMTALSQRIADALRNPFTSQHRQVTVSASVGVAVAGDDSDAQTRGTRTSPCTARRKRAATKSSSSTR